MSAKRKAGGNGAGPNKRRPKKKESDYEDDFSDESDDGAHQAAAAAANQMEVLIPHDDLDPPSKLPEDLLATLEKTPGQLLLAGMVTWDLTGKRDRKNVAKVRPNLFSFHRFTEEKVRIKNTSRCIPELFSYLVFLRISCSTGMWPVDPAPPTPFSLIWIGRRSALVATPAAS